MQQTHTCRQCNVDKPLSEFYKDKSRAGGYDYWCKACRIRRNSLYVKTPVGKEKHNVACRRLYKTEEYKAARMIHRRTNKSKSRKRVQDLVQRKKLQPVSTSECVYCGEQAAYWHHWAGYEKEHWEDVIPLCRRCDRKAHKIAS